MRDRDLPVYPPIRDYALIGDCHGSALVSRDGSVDWCSLGRFDADPIFCRVLDVSKGGFLAIRPESEYETERSYVGSTNILRTVFSTPHGKVAVTDFMPVGRKPGASTHDYVCLGAPHWLVRIVDGVEGEVSVRVGYKPSVEFARQPVRLQSEPWGIGSAQGPSLVTDIALSIDGDCAEGVVAVRAGERRYAVAAAGSLAGIPVAERLDRLHGITLAFWEEWIAYCRYRGPHAREVRRSVLALKLLTYAPTGAVVAAPTASLPEQIGGQRNWDYRYCWIRDATFALYALAAMGYSGEARRFGEFVREASRKTHPRLQIMYGIEGETELDERTLDHLEGYRGSRPVRVGNGAHDQQQLDIYGEILDWAHLDHSLGGSLGQDAQGFWGGLCDFVGAHWEEPGQGIWEMRGSPRHHLFGKVMCWVTVDRTIRLFGSTPERTGLRDEILRAIRERGVDPAGGHLVQAFGSRETDAALLLVPALGLPLDRGVLEKTVDAVQRELQHGDYVYRYRGDDGLEGSEGAFLICSFWLVDALLLLGRAEQAWELYERLLLCGNDVGLYAEEIDPESHEFLGNFPQAFTHLALIQCAAHFEVYRRHGPAAMEGTNADRARYGVEATAGLRAMWAAFKQSGRVGRLWPSRASRLPRGWGL